jgi:hypothetical protein
MVHRTVLPEMMILVMMGTVIQMIMTTPDNEDPDNSNHRDGNSDDSKHGIQNNLQTQSLH